MKRYYTLTCDIETQMPLPDLERLLDIKGSLGSYSIGSQIPSWLTRPVKCECYPMTRLTIAATTNKRLTLERKAVHLTSLIHSIMRKLKLIGKYIIYIRIGVFRSDNSDIDVTIPVALTSLAGALNAPITISCYTCDMTPPDKCEKRVRGIINRKTREQVEGRV